MRKRENAFSEGALPIRQCDAGHAVKKRDVVIKVPKNTTNCRSIIEARDRDEAKPMVGDRQVEDIRRRHEWKREIKMDFGHDMGIKG